MRYFLKVYRSGSSVLAMDLRGDWYQFWYGHWKSSAWFGLYAPRNYTLIANHAVFKCQP